jgi:hypothetical protein
MYLLPVTGLLCIPKGRAPYIHSFPNLYYSITPPAKYANTIYRVNKYKRADLKVGPYFFYRAPREAPFCFSGYDYL